MRMVSAVSQADASETRQEKEEFASIRLGHSHWLPCPASNMSYEVKVGLEPLIQLRCSFVFVMTSTPVSWRLVDWRVVLFINAGPELSVPMRHTPVLIWKVSSFAEERSEERYDALP